LAATELSISFDAFTKPLIPPKQLSVEMSWAAIEIAAIQLAPYPDNADQFGQRLEG
jgi:hypothetical protein